MTVIGVGSNAGILQRLSSLPVRDQRLFLVPDTQDKFNPEAVMLHDGVAKLGQVLLKESRAIREFLDKESLNRGQDQVLVVSLGKLAAGSVTSVCVSGIGLVYERIARKHVKLVNETP